jgi:hypothetical protein
MPSKRIQISVRPTADEHELLKMRAAAFGYKSMSQYLVDRGIGEGVQIENVDKAKLDKLLFEVRKIGVNVNQIALQLNRGYQKYSHQYLDRVFLELEGVLKSLIGE